jgi:hypothetical protein
MAGRAACQALSSGSSSSRWIASAARIYAKRRRAADSRARHRGAGGKHQRLTPQPSVAPAPPCTGPASSAIGCHFGREFQPAGLVVLVRRRARLRAALPRLRLYSSLLDSDTGAIPSMPLKLSRVGRQQNGTLRLLADRPAPQRSPSPCGCWACWADWCAFSASRCHLAASFSQDSLSSSRSARSACSRHSSASRR